MIATPESVERLDRLARLVRKWLIGVGGLVSVIALSTLALRYRAGAALGPTQVQIGLFGGLTLLSGLFHAPAYAIAAAIARARERRPVELRPVSPRQRAVLTAATLVALIFRVVMVSAYWPDHHVVSGMPLWDAEMARNLLAGRGWSVNWAFVERMDRVEGATQKTVDPEDFLPADDAAPGAIAPLPELHTPGYSVWLAISFALGGAKRFIYSQWMQAALDSSVCLLVFGIARRLWSNTAGVFAACFYALSPGHVYLAIQPVAAATDSFWVVLIGYGLVRLAIDSASNRSVVPAMGCIVIGASLGTAMNTLAFALPLVSAGGAVALSLFFRRAWRLAFFLIAAHALVLLALVPWGLRLQRVYGEFAVTRQTVWQHTWEVWGAIPNPWGLVLNTEGGGKDDAFFKWIETNCGARCSTPMTRENFTRDYLFKEVISSPQFPLHIVRLVAKQIPGIVYVSRLPVEDPYVGRTPAGQAFALFLAVVNIAVLAMFPAAAFGLLVLSMRRATALAAWLALVPTAFLVVFSLVLFIEHRKTTQAYGYLMALAGVGCAACWSQRVED